MTNNLPLGELPERSIECAMDTALKRALSTSREWRQPTKKSRRVSVERAFSGMADHARRGRYFRRRGYEVVDRSSAYPPRLPVDAIINPCSALTRTSKVVVIGIVWAVVPIC